MPHEIQPYSWRGCAVLLLGVVLIVAAWVLLASATAGV